MSIWACLLIPILLGAILVIFFKHKLVWWELIIPIVYTLIFILISKWIAVTSLTLDTEYLGGYVTEVRYYEDWNEYIHRICSRSCGKNCTTFYDCSYVKYYPEHWVAVTTLGNFEISERRYNELLAQFKATPQFTELNRPYHTNDGDMYHGDWKGEDETLEPVTVDQHYENKPKASLNVFHFDPLDTSEVKRFKPVKYAPIVDLWHQDCILGYSDPDAEKALQIVNARLGHDYEVRAYIVVFVNQPREAGTVQERYWEGGNMNEIVICIGIDDNKNIQWVYDFSWTDKQDFKIETRNFIENQKQLDLLSSISFLDREIKTKWKRKDFKDFDYLSIEPTTNQVIVILLLILFTNAGIGWWIVENEFDEEYLSYKKRYRW